MSRILRGYDQAIRNATNEPNSMSILVVDHDAYMHAMQFDVKGELLSKYNELNKLNGGLYLQKGLTKNAQKDVKAIIGRISRETTTEDSSGTMQKSNKTTNKASVFDTGEDD